MRREGVAVYNMCSYLNHACSPSAEIKYHGTEIRLTALKDITAGDEITITFAKDVGLAIPGLVQAVVETMHGFKCNCPAHA